MATLTLLGCAWGFATACTPRPVQGPLSSHILFGASAEDLPAGRVGLPDLERRLGTSLRIAAAFVDWSYVIGGPNELWMAAGGKRDVLLAWEPWGTTFRSILDHNKDDYLKQVAESMKSFPYDVYIRPWPEMNAHWSSWQPTAEGSKPEGGTAEEFVAAWRYVVDFMRSNGVTNLRYVFSADASTAPEDTPIHEIWPGADYVDVLGIDGYNWGNSATVSNDTGDRWRSFETIFSKMYQELTELHPTASVWITEVGCKEPAIEDDGNYPQESSPADPTTSKGAWITAMMQSSSFPQISAVVWFNQKKERDWRLESSADSLAAIKPYLSQR